MSRQINQEASVTQTPVISLLPLSCTLLQVRGRHAGQDQYGGEAQTQGEEEEGERKCVQDVTASDW